MNGIIYCRVSSKEQTQGTSLESQEQACREFARSKRIEVLRVFIEQGESAKFADRTQLLALIEFCRENKGKVHSLIVWKVDRFARNVADHFNVKAALGKYGVRIISVTEPIDANPEGKLMETILAGFAEFDNNIRAMRSVQGMRRRLQEGIFPWKAPLGYKSAIGHREKKSRPDVPNQPLFGLLQKVWAAFATGRYTKAEIRRLMKAWGIRTERGQPLTPQSVDHLFRNPYYAGILVDPWSREEHIGQHVPLVSRADFLRVQQVVSGRNRAVHHVRLHPEFPMRGLVRCQACQRNLTGSFSRGRTKRYAYYHCRTRNCAQWAKSLPAEKLHAEFETFLSELTPKPELLQALTETIIRTTRIRTHSDEGREAKAKEAKARLDRQVRELIRMRSEDLITDSEFTVQRRTLLSQQADFESSASRPNPPLTEVRQRLSDIMHPLQRLTEFWRQLPATTRRRFELIVLPVGFVESRIRTAEMGLLFKLFGDFKGGNANAVAPIRKSWNQLWAEITKFSDIIRQSQGVETAPEEAV